MSSTVGMYGDLQGIAGRSLEQVNAALGFVASHAGELHVDPASIVLAGDSAGAHIASQVALITTDAAYAKAIGIARDSSLNSWWRCSWCPASMTYSRWIAAALARSSTNR
jgi:alpha/beta hydrolase fold